MSETKHTPGPWAVVAGYKVPREMSLVTVCTSESDARLIAAAPDLLAACESVCAKPDEVGERLWNVCNAAIRKAKETR